MALIFSVLKMESAPFYILDEFDHALDAGYRSAIATLLNELSQKSQFLITTFKPEIITTVTNAKIYEVTFQSRRSALVPIDQKKALKILQSSAKE